MKELLMNKFHENGIKTEDASVSPFSVEGNFRIKFSDGYEISKDDEVIVIYLKPSYKEYRIVTMIDDFYKDLNDIIEDIKSNQIPRFRDL